MLYIFVVPSLGRLRWEDHFSPEVLRPVGQHTKSPSPNKQVNKKTKKQKLLEIHNHAFFFFSWYKEEHTLRTGDFLCRYKFPLVKGNSYPVFRPAVSQNNQLKILLLLKRHILGWYIQFYILHADTKQVSLYYCSRKKETTDLFFFFSTGTQSPRAFPILH
jgi:hypothetical protein